MTDQKKVRVTKLKAVDSPDYRTPDAKDYIPGGINPDRSLPTDYEMEGYYVFGPPVPGRAFALIRTHRNGIKVNGACVTSTVQDVAYMTDGVIEFTTKNSVYRVEEIEDDLQDAG